MCQDGLEGAFCQLCINASAGDTFYVKGEGETPAHCEPCADTAGVTGAIAGGAIAAALLFAYLGRATLHRISTGRIESARRVAVDFRLGVKLKILIGFYQVRVALA